MNKTYYRTATLANITIDKERGVVKGVNDFGGNVVMTIKQFESMYKEEKQNEQN